MTAEREQEPQAEPEVDGPIIAGPRVLSVTSWQLKWASWTMTPRHGIEDKVAHLAQQLGIPVVTTFMGRGLLADSERYLTLRSS
jgi:hypothetical protein